MLHMMNGWTTKEVLLDETWIQNMFAMLPGSYILHFPKHSPVLLASLSTTPDFAQSLNQYSEDKVTLQSCGSPHTPRRQMNLVFKVRSSLINLNTQVTVRPLVVFRKDGAHVWLFNLGFCWQLNWPHLISTNYHLPIRAQKPICLDSVSHPLHSTITM